MTTSKCSVVCIVLWVATLSQGQAQTSIDSILAAEHAARSIDPAPLCSDEVFLRRVTLDLAGRIPTLQEVKEFKDDPNRARKIKELLSSEEFNTSWADVWTNVLVGYETEFQYGREALHGWLEKALRDRMSYDKLAGQLISATGQLALDGKVAFLLKHREEPAVRVSRVFLGVRLDCARCHDHPFDRWTQQDFESFAKFFQGMEVREISEQNLELTDRPEMTNQVALEERPRFFTSARPRTSLWRNELALLVTSCKPFARVYANRIWYQLVGRGIVPTPDDFSSKSPPGSQALLDYLSEQARQQKFDIRSMVELICNSNAYQRSSTKTPRSSYDEDLFAVRVIKPLTPEQLVDSIAQSLDIAFTVERRAELIGYCAGPTDDEFGQTNRYRESVQGLMMRLTDKVKSPTPSLDELYLRTLGRLPTQTQRQKSQQHAIDDVAFALVHSSEYFFNH